MKAVGELVELLLPPFVLFADDAEEASPISRAQY